MGFKQGAQVAAGPPCAQFGGREGPTVLGRDIGEAPAFHVMEREQGALVRAELGEQGLDLIGRMTRCRVATGVNRLGCGSLVRRAGRLDHPASAHRFAPKIVAPGIRGDAQQPVDKRLLRPPTGQSPNRAQEGVLDQVIKVRLRAHESPEQPGNGGVMPFDEFRHGGSVALLGPLRPFLVGIAGHGRFNREVHRFLGVFCGIFEGGFQTTGLDRPEGCAFEDVTRGRIADETGGADFINEPECSPRIMVWRAAAWSWWSPSE